MTYAVIRERGRYVFGGDGNDTSGRRTVTVEPSYRVNNEVRGIVLDGDGADEMRPDLNQPPAAACHTDVR